MIDLIEHKRKELNAICRRHAVTNIYLFGSAVKGSYKTSSDLDFAVLLSEKLSPLEHGSGFFNLKASLEDLFQREIDLVSYRVVKIPVFKEELDKTKIELYAA
ncbi:nucleotidyltransferase domain-containing protein [Algoriphagus sp. AGSA1]|uniref:nucleotidyltransferase family protein n=1 Tax=Algoriphagus sp. AGSA1 TaxID=2907213 RepID=UPI001F1BB484|nr:nucleotidyltransferase domain-containing protein [Algoriphagus sp. AGSA1]MCE7053377.1 nucleotidyltransferase domain-containing protein [Algoriphagus sp. AGSA1]